MFLMKIQTYIHIFGCQICSHHTQLMLQIQELVAKIGVQTTEYLLNTMRDRRNLERAYVASMPQIRCTLLGYKYMLEPGAQNHPDNLTNPVLRNPTTTRIVQAPGELYNLCIHQLCQICPFKHLYN